MSGSPGERGGGYLGEGIENRIRELIRRYPRPASALVPILQLIQDEEGWISARSQEIVARRLGIPPAWVAGVVSFYTLLQDRRIGRYHLQVCSTLPCALRGCERLLEHISGRLGIPAGGTTPDEKFSLSRVQCLGSCDTAPVVQINEECFENLTPEKMDQILDRLT